MEPGKVVSTGPAVDLKALCPQGAHTASPIPPAKLIVVVEVEPGQGSGLKESHGPTLLLEGSKSLRLLQPGTLEPQEHCFIFDRVLGPGAAQEAEQELLTQIQPMLASVGQGYNTALLLQGRETEAPRFVPQVLQVLFEEALPLCGSGPVLCTLSLVQISPSGQTQDLLSPCLEDLPVLDVTPLGLVVKDAREVEVSDARAASELYLKAAGHEARDCPLLRVLAGEAAGEEEGSLPWIVSWLLEGNSYSSLLLRLDPQGGSSPTLLQAALLGASGKRVQVKEVRPTLWNAVEEMRARRDTLKTLRSVLLGDILTDGGLSQFERALWELQAHQAPDVALQFFLAQARRQRLREQYRIWIQEELKHVEHQEGGACKQSKGMLAEEACEEGETQWKERTVLKLQVEALQAERDMAEHDLVALYDLYVQATRARTCHLLQGLWEEKAMATEHHHRSLLAGVLQDTIDLALKTQELQSRNQQLEQSADCAGVLPGEEPDQGRYGATFRCPHS
ncbi:Kinesin, motor domain containing protein [Cricetulus griseus]|nr:Kinesin, motor domain containing protein [Cricetulus griseus]